MRVKTLRIERLCRDLKAHGPENECTWQVLCFCSRTPRKPESVTNKVFMFIPRSEHEHMEGNVVVLITLLPCVTRQRADGEKDEVTCVQPRVVKIIKASVWIYFLEHRASNGVKRGLSIATRSFLRWHFPAHANKHVLICKWLAFFKSPLKVSRRRSESFACLCSFVSFWRCAHSRSCTAFLIVLW